MDNLQRVKANKRQASPPESVNLKREGDKAPKARTIAKNLLCILYRASDWEIRVELKKRLVFSEEVAANVTLTRRGSSVKEHKKHLSC